MPIRPENRASRVGAGSMPCLGRPISSPSIRGGVAWRDHVLGKEVNQLD